MIFPALTLCQNDSICTSVSSKYIKCCCELNWSSLKTTALIKRKNVDVWRLSSRVRQFRNFRLCIHRAGKRITLVLMVTAFFLLKLYLHITRVCLFLFLFFFSDTAYSIRYGIFYSTLSKASGVYFKIGSLIGPVAKFIWSVYWIHKSGSGVYQSWCNAIKAALMSLIMFNARFPLRMGTVSQKHRKHLWTNAGGITI